jgi:cellulose synthase/poly-beta-1,6-N-acetylglucosamine synthase-like glycosyltransferase
VLSAIRTADGRLIFFLLVGIVVTVIIGASQLYFLLQMFYEMSERPDLADWTKILFPFYFLIFTVLFFGRYFAIMLFAFLEAAKVRLEQPRSSGEWPLVTILVPAHNEADVIEKTIESLLKIDYPSLEVIVIDDGSTDDTFSLVAPLAGTYVDRSIFVLKKTQGGKASALNVGFQHSRGKCILSMDADSQLAPDSVKKLVSRLQEKGVQLCSGQVSIANRHNLLTHLQSLEYILMNGTGRAFQSYFRSVLIAPGPISMFRREILEELKDRQLRTHLTSRDAPADHQGPWETDTFAEDAKLSLSLLATGSGSVYEPAALCFTKAPDSIDGLLNQRYRWIRGNLQAIKRSWTLWRHYPSDRPHLGLWLVWFAAEAFLWPVIGVASLFIFVSFLATAGGFGYAYGWFGLLMLADVAAAAFAVTASRQVYGSIVYMPIYRFFYQVLLEFNSILAIFDEIRDYRMRW